MTLASDARPSPEALLGAAAREGQGRLKLFLGAAPGVGKTYQMLATAQAKRRDGVDVVVGVVETHGRKETEALLDGLEVVPRRRVEYKGRWIEEMDLDALLARRPAIALVDELAHTNAPGSRHPKRYMDVEELLAAGIDVYTTLNVQHVESLNDVVAKITRIRVRETVPDMVIDRADDIELIDLTPEDLIRRLEEGKVYVPEQAQRAVRHYFSPGNLTALRELALRRTAARVDEQMLTYMQAHAIHGPWAAGERVLVCINEEPGAASLVRYARRLADRLRAPWTALYIETHRHHRLGDGARDRIADGLRLAERLGGEAITIPGRRVAEEVLAWAGANNITQVVIGRSVRSRWHELVHGSVVRDLVRGAGGLSVHVMAGDEGVVAPKGVTTQPAPRRLDLSTYARTAALVAAALVVAVALQHVFDVSNVALVFLTAVVLVATAWGLGPSLFACALSVLAYNFFFLPPFFTLTVADPDNVVGLFFFLLVAVVVSNLTAGARGQAIAARERAKATAELYAFSRKIAGIGDLDDLLWAAAYQMASMLHCRVVLLLPEGETIDVRAGYPPEDALAEADLAAARWCWTNNRAAGRDSDTLPGAKRLFLPLRTERGPVGVVGIDRDEPGPLLTPDQRRLLDALADQAAVAVERMRLAGDVDAARIVAETERTRSALLASISHDLKTPLAAIIGAVTSLRRFGERGDAAQRDELAQTIQEEAERLDRFIGNLLDITRLESGAVRPHLDAVDVGEVVGTALRRARRILERHRVSLDLGDDLPILDLDFLLLEQTLFNLLDNAAKHAPAGSAITVRACRRDGGVAIEILDEGVGIRAGEEERIFDKFYRLSDRDARRAGTGLGLSICRGFVAAMGGRIGARNRADRQGAVFTIEFPASTATKPQSGTHAPPG
jgi:two-component system sensor histidine kinase KdpD